MNFGVLPLDFADPADHDRIQPGDVLHLKDLHSTLATSKELTVTRDNNDGSFTVTHQLSPRQIDTVLVGGRIPQLLEQRRSG